MKAVQKVLPYDIAKEGLDEQGREKDLGKTFGAQGMSSSDKRWTVQDRYGNSIYLTQERWEHIIDDANHPEMDAYEEYLKTTIKKGRRRQEPLNIPTSTDTIIYLAICLMTSITWLPLSRLVLMLKKTGKPYHRILLQQPSTSISG